MRSHRFSIVPVAILGCALVRSIFASDPPTQTLWSLRPLIRPEPPAVRSGDRVEHPIDRFIIARLEEADLALGPPADRRTLLRRASFDLLGLPPSPAEVARFVADPRPDDLAFADIVDRMLASPRYGEREARRWIDLVHWAETHGHDEDAIRENAWPYRDWLVHAFNEDVSWSRFVSAQVAGDVLYPDDPWATVATGLLASGPWDESSQMGIQDGTTDKEIARILDRDDILTTVMSSFTSLTVHCARCHDHKFDPIPQKDYWALQAVFAGVDRVDRAWDPDPEVKIRRNEIEQEIAALDDDDHLRGRLEEETFRTETAKLVADLGRKRDRWTVVVPDSVATASGAPHRVLDDGSVLFGGTPPATDSYTFRLRASIAQAASLRVEVLPDASLPAKGPGRAVNGNLHLSEVRVTAGDATSAIPIRTAVADFDQDGWTIAHAIDGNPETAWGVHPHEGEAHSAAFRFADPVAAMPAAGGPDQVSIAVTLDQLHGREHVIGRVRMSLSEDPNAPLETVLPPRVDRALGRAPAERSEDERFTLARFVLRRKLQGELDRLPPPEKVYAVATDFSAVGNFKPAHGPRPVWVLKRGDVHSPIEPAEPGALSLIAALPSRFALENPNDEGERRAALARWLVDSRNVLVWRSIANRVWQTHFGRGIVATPNDFGRNGDPPSHPDLLDWLAVELRDGGGSLKSLHRAILTSAAYQQAWREDAAALAADPENRLLWRASLRRLDAESIRDAELLISGEMDFEMYGPSARQFLTRPGVHITPVVDYASFSPSDPANRRRSIWRFIFRTQPDPWFQALDCPDASQLTPRRTESVTVLQALALLHHGLQIELAEKLAARLGREAETLEARIQRLWRLAFAREPDIDEIALVSEYVKKHGISNACRWVLNLDEFIYVD